HPGGSKDARDAGGSEIQPLLMVSTPNGHLLREPTLYSITDLKIHDELRTALPPLTGTEQAMLDESIVKEGVREPLIVWAQGEDIFIVDGHNRYEIARKHGHTSVPARLMKFADAKEAVKWVIANQWARRNLAPMQRSYYRGKHYLRARKSNGGNRADSGA